MRSRVTGRIVAHRIVVGLVAQRGEALRRAVERQLAPGDPHPAHVVPALVLHDVVAVGLDIDVDRDVVVEPAFVRDRAEHLGQRRDRAALLGRGVAEARPERRARLRQLLEALRADPAQKRDDVGVHRGFFQDAVRLLAARPTPDDSAGRVGGLRGQADGLERLGVHRAEMRRLMDEKDRVFGRHGVEVVARGVAQFGELGVVVAEAEDQVRLRHGLGIGGDPFAQRFLQGRDAAARTVGRRQHVGRKRLNAAEDDVPVRIDEARQHRACPKVDDLRPRPLQCQYLGGRAHGEDPSVLHRHGLHPHRGVVHREDRAARPDPVSRPGRLGRHEPHASDGQRQSGGRSLEKRPAVQVVRRDGNSVRHLILSCWRRRVSRTPVFSGHPVPQTRPPEITAARHAISTTAA